VPLINVITYLVTYLTDLNGICTLSTSNRFFAYHLALNTYTHYLIKFGDEGTFCCIREAIRMSGKENVLLSQRSWLLGAP